jgi:hypothetical protein
MIKNPPLAGFLLRQLRHWSMSTRGKSYIALRRSLMTNVQTNDDALHRLQLNRICL